MPSAAPPVVAESATTHPLVARALVDVGKREGDPSLPFATSARPWCAAWCSGLLVELGAIGAPEWNARALLRLLARLGYSQPHTDLAAGDVVGWPRRGGPDAAHVGIVVEVESARVRVVSGNSAPEGSRRSDRVTDRWYPRARVRWAARPIA